MQWKKKEYLLADKIYNTRIIYGRHALLASLSNDFNESKYLHFTKINKIPVVLCAMDIKEFKKYVDSVPGDVYILFLENNLDFSLFDTANYCKIFFIDEPKFRFVNNVFTTLNSSLKISLDRFLSYSDDIEYINDDKPSVTIIGPTNVGKSTLTNALLSKNVSLVKDEMFTTKGIVKIDDILKFTVMDTEGFVKANYSTMTYKFEKQLDSSYLILLVTDPTNYNTSVMRAIMGWAQKTKKNFIILCNKSDLIDKEDKESIRDAFRPMLINNDIIFTSALYPDKVDSLRSYLYDFVYKKEIIYAPTNYLTKLLSKYDAILYIKQLRKEEIAKPIIEYSFLVRIKRNKDITQAQLKNIKRIISGALKIRNYYIEITLCR